MKEPSLAPDEALALLRENASRLAALTERVPSGRLHDVPSPEEWSPNDVLAHIRVCCDVWGRNMARILAEEHPTFRGVSPRTWMKRTDYPKWRFEEAMRAFAAQREALLITLQALTLDGWERTATVISYGQSNERTLLSYASQLATHERIHVRQIEQALA